MDESFFTGVPKFNRGWTLGTFWEDDKKWTLDKPKETLIAFKCTLQGFFFLDGWKAYIKLARNVNITNALNYPANHNKKFGCTIKQIWVFIQI